MMKTYVGGDIWERVMRANISELGMEYFFVSLSEMAEITTGPF